MTEPSPVNDIRADLLQIRVALASYCVDFETRSLSGPLTDAVRTLSQCGGATPPRPPLLPYADASSLIRDVRSARDRLELGLADGTIADADVMAASSALIELGRGIALHLRMTRRDAAPAAAA